MYTHAVMFTLAPANTRSDRKVVKPIVVKHCCGDKTAHARDSGEALLPVCPSAAEAETGYSVGATIQKYFILTDQGPVR